MYFLKIFISLTITTALFSCASKKNNVTNNSIATTNFAKNFNVIKHKNFTELQLINPENGTIEKKYALYKLTKQKPKDKTFIPLQIPLKSIITLNGTDIGILDKLNLIQKIKGIENINYIYSPTLKKNFRNGKLIEISDLNQTSPERIAEKTNFISYAGFGNKLAHEEKLLKLGVTCMPIYDWREQHPLGKAEWIKVFALLFDREKAGNIYFNTIKKKYNAHLKLIKNTKNSPTVLSGQMIGDYWYMPGGSSFNAELFTKAKGDYVGKSKTGTGSNAFTFEEILTNFQNAKIWINPGFSSKKKLLKSFEKYKYLKAFQTDNIYCYSHNSNFFWERSAIEPHRVLSDFIQIFHPELKSKKNLYFYKKITD